MGCDQPSFVPIGPFLSELWYANIFQHGGRPPLWILKILIFGHVTVIAALTCCCIPNFIEIGSRIRPPDAHNCRMFNAPLVGNGRCHGNRIVGDMSGTWCDVTTQLRSQSVGTRSFDWRVMTFRIFSNMAAVRHSEFNKKLIFDHMTVIVVLICVCLLNFIKIGSRVRPPDAHNCRMFNASLLINGRCHGNRIMADMSRTWWDVTTQFASQSVHW